jgi:hypothetical protein
LERIAAVEVDAEAVTTADDEGAAFAKTTPLVAIAFGAIEDEVALIDWTLETIAAVEDDAEAVATTNDEGAALAKTTAVVAAAFGAIEDEVALTD